ncbi:MAG: Clp protease/crotonase-like domain-containing protein [Planctomycetota bacterium]
MNRIMKQTTLLLSVLAFSLPLMADTFTHQTSGQSFDGFMTQKTLGGKTRVYDSSQKQMVTVDLSEYHITPNSKGRREVAIVVPINQSEILLSEVIAKDIAKTIIESANRGSQVVIVHIDSPGGRGDYMQIIASAIEKTTNCPVVAYISADAYGGAFSSAAVLALACDRIYIAPTASMGAVGPISDLAATPEDFQDYMSTYASDILMLQRIDAEAERLAKARKRPGLLARGLIDKRLSISEVNTDGSQQFIETDKRQATQTLVRTLSQGAAAMDKGENVTPVDIVSSSLTLSAHDAIEVGLADESAGSYYDILVAMNIPDTKINATAGIKNTIKKYQAARRNISNMLTRIDWLEKQATTLEEQVAYIDEQLRTGTTTREVRRGAEGIQQRKSGNRRSNLPDDYDSYYYDPSNVNTSITSGIVNRSSGSRSNQTRAIGSETITTVAPNTRLVEAQRELARVLEELRNEYRRTSSLAKRWPGSLPPDIRAATLEKNIVSVESTLNYLYADIDETLRQESLPNQNRTTQNRSNRYYQ